jgi:hypothetical protein
MNDRFEYFDLLTKFDAFGAGRSWIISWIIHDQKLNQIAKSDQISLSQSQSGTERLRFLRFFEFLSTFSANLIYIGTGGGDMPPSLESSSHPHLGQSSDDVHTTQPPLCFRRNLCSQYT